MFGQMVRAHRRRLGMSQEALAETIGVSVRGLRKIETNRIGTPRPVTVQLLADAFGLSDQERDRFFEIAFDKTDQRAHVPAQLPLDVHGFTGRTGQLDALDAIAAASAGQPTAMVISVVWGTAGVGKTALAVHWAHRVRDRFPDGQLYVNLRGFSPGIGIMAPTDAVRRFLDALGMDARRIPADLDGQTALYRTLLATRRMLVVLDNARDADQVRPLLPGAPGCLALVTSRNQLTSLVVGEGACPVPLDLFTVDEARDLLVHRLDRQRTATEPDSVDEIVTQCARLPLALAIVAARAAIEANLSLADLAADLRERHDRLDMLVTGNATTDLRAVFSWSYDALTPDTARLFRLLGLHPGPDVSRTAAASLVAVAPQQARRLLADLTRAHLITECAPGRYTLHDLLRAYATEQTVRHDTADERHTARHRVLDHYLHTAHAADRLLDPTRDRIALPPARAGVTLNEPTDHQQALTWFKAEHPVLLAAVRTATDAGLATHTWRLATALTTFLFRQGHWHDQLAAGHAALAATEQLDDPAAQAQIRCNLALTYIQLGRYGDAEAHLRRALDLYRRCENRAGQAYIHGNLAFLCDRDGRLDDAVSHVQQALNLFQAADHPHGAAKALNNLGWYHARLGNHPLAIDYCQQALNLQRELGNRIAEADTWDTLGYAHQSLGNHSEAIACYHSALDLFRESGDRYWEANTLTHLGDAHHAAGDADAARDWWQRAVDILTDLDHPDAGNVRAKLHNGR